jgi:signal transduction histidine kinase
METEFRLSAEGRRQQFLRVEVSDSGRGMDAADMAQLFTPFFTTKPSGTGLGLVLSRQIVAAHGGKLWAEAGGIDLSAQASVNHPVLATAAPHPVHRAKPEEHRTRGMTFKVTLPVGPRAPERSESA